jgi:hypothetical protein
MLEYSNGAKVPKEAQDGTRWRSFARHLPPVNPDLQSAPRAQSGFPSAMRSSAGYTSFLCDLCRMKEVVARITGCVDGFDGLHRNVVSIFRSHQRGHNSRRDVMATEAAKGSSRTRVRNSVPALVYQLKNRLGWKGRKEVERSADKETPLVFTSKIDNS